MIIEIACNSDSFLFFFFNDTATTEIYTLSLHDALPIFQEHFVLPLQHGHVPLLHGQFSNICENSRAHLGCRHDYSHLRSEEHTSELQSRQYLVCRLLLEKKNKYLNLSIRSSLLLSY